MTHSHTVITPVITAPGTNTLLATFNRLAFLSHTVLGLMDTNYQLVRRKILFDDIRELTRYLCFESWEALLRFMMRGLELEAQDQKVIPARALCMWAM